MDADGSSYPVGRKPGPCQPLGLAYGFRPGQLYRVTQSTLSDASNNARMYRPRRKEIRI